MGPLDVRRLAAIDMYGVAGTMRRRMIIVAEFALGAVVGTSLGLFVALASGSLPLQIFGAYIAGTCLNYVPLTLHALSLLRPGALETELAGVDIQRELRRYTALQLWLAVPLLLIPFGLLQLRWR